MRLIFLELDHVVRRYELALVYQSVVRVYLVGERRRGRHQDVRDGAFPSRFVLFGRLDVVDHAALGFELEYAERLRYEIECAKNIRSFLKSVSQEEYPRPFLAASYQVLQLIDQRIQNIESVLLAFLSFEFVYGDVVSHVRIVQEVFVEYAAFIIVESRQRVYPSHQFLFQDLRPAVLVGLGSLRDFVYVVAAGDQVQIVLSSEVWVYQLLGVVLQQLPGRAFGQSEPRERYALILSLIYEEIGHGIRFTCLAAA